MRGCDVVGIIGPRSNPVTEKVAYIFGSKLPVVTVTNSNKDGYKHKTLGFIYE